MRMRTDECKDVDAAREQLAKAQGSQMALRKELKNANKQIQSFLKKLEVTKSESRNSRAEQLEIENEMKDLR